MGEAGGAYFYAIGLVGTVGNQVDAKLTLGMFNGGIILPFRNTIALGKQFEVMYQRFHVAFHLFTSGRY